VVEQELGIAASSGLAKLLTQKFGCDTTVPNSAVWPPNPSASISAFRIHVRSAFDQPSRDLQFVSRDEDKIRWWKRIARLES
jgi:hypothetical protein